MLYVLDLDDTLILEKDFVYSGFKAVDHWLASNSIVKDFFEIALKIFEEGRRGDVFNRALESAGYSPSSDLINTLINVYRSHKPKISLLSDAIEFLNFFDKKSLALITDGYSETQWNKIKALDIERHIGNIIVTGDWGKEYWKPHPRAFIETSRGYQRSECIYIGDNPHKDFYAPLQLNWLPSIRIRRPGSLHENAVTPEWCLEITSLSGFEWLRKEAIF